MSKGDRDGRGFRHHKACPSLNCERCVNGRAKAPARRAARRQAKRETRKVQYDPRPAQVIPSTLVRGWQY